MGRGVGKCSSHPNEKNAGSNLPPVLLKIYLKSQNKDVPDCPLFWLNTVTSSSMQTLLAHVQPDTINKWT